MSVAPILNKVFLVDLLKGLKVTFKYQHPKEVYTEQYPLERPAIAERYRGLPRLNVNPETGETLCIACNLCATACPEHLIVVQSERNPATKRKEMTSFTLDISRCMFCKPTPPGHNSPRCWMRRWSGWANRTGPRW